VATCEESGQNVDGSQYAGYFGITKQSWAAYNTFGFPADAYYATFDQQVVVGMAITGGWIPDANGCSSW
jgi:hypothetical protein